MKLLSPIYDNAMLYKDMTQWLRNRTFVVLFWGILLSSEALALFVGFFGSQDEALGQSVFYPLFMLLLIYSLIIAFMAHNLTTREFQNRTFELYELSGMSLERLISGKFFSMLYQFMFGFFCVIPFMFFSYFLGGLDFLVIFASILSTLIFVIPIFLISLLVALTSRLKQISTLGRFLAVGMLILFAVVSVPMMFSRRSPLRELFDEASRVINAGVLGDPAALAALGIFALFYIQFCLLLFYLCCNTVSRETDSREVAIKVLITSISLTWVLTVLKIASNPMANDAAIGICTPILVGMLLLGLASFYNQIRIPVIVRNKYRNIRGLKGFLYYWFQPGPRGTMRTLLLLMMLACSTWGYLYFANYAYVPARFNSKWFDAMSMLIQVPYFLVFPAVFLFSKKLKENYPMQRILVAIWWGIAGAIVGFAVGDARMHSRLYTPLLEYVALVMSPASSTVGMVGSRTMLSVQAPYIRCVLGILGFIVIMMHLRRRQRELPATATR